MKDRLKEIMAHLSVTAAELADKIGVQRSSISHILNGRNLPGSPFIEKLLNTYPGIDARWLITGKGTMLRSGDTPKPGETGKTDLVQPPEIKPPGAAMVDNAPVAGRGKKVEKVLFFYQDRSFSEYFPL